MIQAVRQYRKPATGSLSAYDGIQSSRSPTFSPFCPALQDFAVFRPLFQFKYSAEPYRRVVDIKALISFRSCRNLGAVRKQLFILTHIQI